MSFTVLCYWTAISLGAIAGALTRHFIQSLFNKSHVKPYGTLIANTLGCFIMGIAASLPTKYTQSIWYQASTIGFCASFTTFSSVVLEIYFMLRKSAYNNVLNYVLLLFILSLIAIWAGEYLGFIILRG